MRLLTLDEVYTIHQAMIRIGGGRGNIHDFSLLHSAVERPKATFGGKELYPTVWLKAAALLHSLVKNHPFDDGNKRTGYYSTSAFFWTAVNFCKALPCRNYALESEERMQN